ncbi:MAG: glycosyltransferase [Planctomycetota bacterium]
MDPAPLLAPAEVGHRPWHDYAFTLGIGELKERKGHHVALAAWAEAARTRPELHHVLVGNRPADDYERSLLAIAERAGVADRLHLVGNVTEDEKRDLLQRCLAFLHTPVRAADGGFEGFGIVYLEASACAKPVLGTLHCGAEDAIVDGRTGYLVEPDVASAKLALERLLDDAELRERLGAAGREHALANTWHENAAVVLGIYDGVLARRERR